jgi:glycosyltransferase involved in cell wall biosynthesis
VLWAHYKAAVFTDLHRQAQLRGYQIEFVHFAESERVRKLGPADYSQHKYPYKLLFNGAFEDVPVLKRIWVAACDAFEFDGELAVLPGYYDAAFWILALIFRLRGIKTIVCVDSTEVDQPRAGWKEAIKRIFFKVADGAFCYGSRSKAYAISLGLNTSQVFERCQATNNAEIEAQYDKYRRRHERTSFPRNVIYVGRLSVEKNIETLIKAFAELGGLQQFADWGVLVVGDGPARQDLEKLSEQLMPGRVQFLGSVPWDEVPKFFACADLFVLPSLSEPWGLVVNEAMVCGLPVVVSKNCGAACDLIDEGRNGFSFDPTSVEELTGALRKLMQSEDLRREFGRRGRQIVAAYTPEAAASQMLHGIDQLLIAA